MKSIRRKCFETNSSSVHSLIWENEDPEDVIDWETQLEPQPIQMEKCNIPISKTGKIRVKVRYFGKDFSIDWDQETKLSYLMVLCMKSRYDAGRESFKEQVEEMKDFLPYTDVLRSLRHYIPNLKEIIPVYSVGWGMDHQANNNYDEPKDFLQELSPAEFVLGSNVGLFTRCD